MSQSECLILTQGRTVCLLLDSAIRLLLEMNFKDETSKAIRDEGSSDIFNTIVLVATISCGKDVWQEVYAFLRDIGISVPSDFSLEMMYMESVSELLPSEGKHN